MQKLSVLHINKYHYFRDGATNVYLRTASLLESYGHKSVFFSMHSKDNLDCETGYYFLPHVDLNEEGLSISEQIGIAARFLYSLQARGLLAKLLDKYSVDIAHLHNIYHHISPSIIHELKKRGIPVVMTLHDYKMICGAHALLHHGKICESCRGKKHYVAVRKKCVKESLLKSTLTAVEMYLHHNILDIYKNVDIFISPSKFLLEKHRELGFSKEIVHLPNFFDSTEIEAYGMEREKENNVSHDCFVYIGRISEEKGLRTLIDAAKLLVREIKYKQLKIKVIGEGPLLNELQLRVRDEKIDNVLFLGYMTGRKLFQEIINSIALILPSEWYENNPLSVIEAFSVRKPVIGARIGGIPEMVKDNQTGLTFQSGDAYDLSLKMKYLYDNYPAARLMGENAKLYVSRDLNVKDHYDKLMEIYMRAIKKIK